MPRTRRRFLATLAGLASLGACTRASREPSACPSGDAAASDAAYPELAGACAGVPAIAREEFEARIERVRARMHEHDVAALIVEAGHDMQWLGGPRWGRSERALLLLVPREGATTLLGPAFEAGTLAARQGGLSHAVEVWHEHEDPHALALALLGGAASGPIVVGSDTRTFVVEGLRRVAPTRGFAAAEAIIEPLRRCKSAAELALMRRANEVTKRAIAAAAARVRVGMHEHELADEVAAALRAAGLDEPWVLPLFGPNAAYPHGTPEGRTLVEGDMILVDTGAFLHGYASDITRTWHFGEPGSLDAKRREAWAAVRSAQAAALALIRPGITCDEVDAAARAVIAGAGFAPDYGHFTHRLGHGIGMQVHEPPYLVRGNAHRLELGNTMSNEPGVYLPGAFGIRLEDIVAVGEQGPEVFGPLASSPDSPA